MKLAAGIDVGGTKCLAVLVDEQGAIVAQDRVPTPSADVLAETLIELVNSLGQFNSLGIGVPGLVTTAGIVRSSPNMPTAVELPLRKQLEERLGHVVGVDNDATCAAFAEWKFGAGIGSTNMWMVTLGTGIGGGLISGGTLQRGANGFAGEIGHMLIDPKGPKCPCGKTGCWERYASGSGLAYFAQSATGEAVIVEARRGDKRARDALDTFAYWVAVGLANLANMTDPDTLVIGGGVSEDADMFMPKVIDWFGKLLYAPEHRQHPALKVAKLGQCAGAVGAATMARQGGSGG